MVSAYVCPVCGGDRSAPFWTERLMAKMQECGGAASGILDPGGAEFRFPNGQILRISTECNTCDEAKLMRELRVQSNENML